MHGWQKGWKAPCCYQTILHMPVGEGHRRACLRCQTKDDRSPTIAEETIACIRESMEVFSLSRAAIVLLPKGI